ncbi:hypothetical protein FRC11_010956, partial [Ceratobasidium sp. 423]
MKGANNTIEYVEKWEAIDQQTPHITSFVASKSIPCLLSASEDHTLLFTDVDSGKLIGIIDLENFYVLAAIWQSNSMLILSGSNGVVYEMVINPKNQLHPVSMYAIIGPLHQQVRAVAYDAMGVHTLLAVGHRTQVLIYVQMLQDHEWNKVNDILEPSHTQGRGRMEMLVSGNMALPMFVMLTPQIMWGFVGYPNSGQARLGPNQETISIMTLDQSIMVYCLGDNGPILETGHKYPLQVPLASNPILPIEHTPSGLILGGTSSGNISIIKPPKDGSNVGTLIWGIHQGDGHLIRAFVYYGPHILVGSMAPNNQVVIKCFTDSRKFKGPTHKCPSYKPFRLSLSDALVVSREGHKRTVVTIDNPTGLVALFHSRDMR